MRIAVRPRPVTPRFGQLAEIARDLAARIEGNIMARPKKAAGARATARPGTGKGMRVTRGAATGRGRPPVRASSGGGALANIADHVLGMRLPHPMEAIEVALLSQAMTDASGNITAAARLLGIHRKAVERKLVKHRLSSRPAAKQKPAKRTIRRKPARRSARR